MTNYPKNIIPITLEEELKKSYLDYAMSVIIGRALPDVRDGLKPVHRRILFAMYVLKNYWNKSYKKSARIVGDVIGKYHPHGDTAVYDAIVRMTQSFSLRYTLIDGQGNFGSIDGDSAAAMRYTEIRMSKISHEFLTDLDRKTVNFISNYDNTELIPEILPAKIPNLLINGSSGIAVGMATNIPPHNLKEIIDGCIAYIDDKKISIKTLMNYIRGPDFPTGSAITGIEGIKNAYKTGRGKIYIQAKAKIKVDKKNLKEKIIISEIPYQVNKARLIEKIVELVKEKKIEGINALRDESDKDGMRIVIEVKKDSIAKIVLNNLYQNTQLKISFGINMVALNNGKPELMSLKKILKAFIFHRRKIVTRRTIFELKKTKKRIYTLQALEIAIENINLVIKFIRNAINTKEAKKMLMKNPWKLGKININLKNLNKKYVEKNLQNLTVSSKKNDDIYFLTEKQAKSILKLRLQKFTNIEKNKLLEEYQNLLIYIKELLYILENPVYLLDVIRKELKEIRKSFGDERRTKIISENKKIKIENLIHKENIVITLSRQGYVKYQPLNDYHAQHRGGKGKSAVHIKEKDFIDKLLIANTHDTILCFSSQGKLYWIKVYQLPLASRISRGKPIINLLPLKKKERITAILPISKYKKNLNILMATKKGIIKKIALTEFSQPRNNGIIALYLRKNDELIDVSLTKGNDEIMLFSANGKVVRFSEKKVRNMGRNAIGVRGIKLVKNDYVVSLIVPDKKCMILTVTKNGYGKCTLIEKYPSKSRATKGVIGIKVSKRNGLVIGAVQVNSKNQIMIITNSGVLLRIRVSEIRIASRNTKGVMLIRTETNKGVAAIQCILGI